MTASLPTTYIPSGMEMSIGARVMFDDALYEKCRAAAKIMAGAKGMAPPHLIGCPEACFAVVIKAMTWRLEMFSVAQSTYQTPGGKVGFEGKLVQAILENCGLLEGQVTYELFGDWSRIQGKWKEQTSQKGTKYPVPTWTDADEEGLGVVVSAQVRGEAERRSLRFLMREAYPRNSILWATRPSQQIKYTAVRAFANLCAPGLMFGVPWREDEEAGAMRDITPVRDQRPERRAAIDVDDLEDAGHDAYKAGYDARHAGVAFRAAPRELSASEVGEWRRGWQAADAEAHGAESEPTDQAHDPDTGEIAEPEPTPAYLDLMATLDEPMSASELAQIENRAATVIGSLPEHERRAVMERVARKREAFA